jgi:hypothetical protein
MEIPNAINRTLRPPAPTSLYQVAERLPLHWRAEDWRD